MILDEKEFKSLCNEIIYVAYQHKIKLDTINSVIAKVTKKGTKDLELLCNEIVSIARQHGIKLAVVNTIIAKAIKNREYEIIKQKKLLTETIEYKNSHVKQMVYGPPPVQQQTMVIEGQQMVYGPPTIPKETIYEENIQMVYGPPPIQRKSSR